MRRAQARQELAKDFVFILIGIVIAVAGVSVGAIDWLIRLFGGDVLASFISGVFFTSAFTLAPSAVALVHISSTAPTWLVVFWGALGAVFGDLLLFFFIRDRFARDISASLKPSLAKHILSSFHLGFLKWLSPLLGALIIASPLPDEFGLMLLGISKIRVMVLVPIAFVMNALGIYILIWFAGLV